MGAVYSDFDKLSEDETRAYAAMGKLVCAWNAIEGWVRVLIQDMIVAEVSVRGISRAMIMTAEVNAIGLKHILDAISDQISGTEISNMLKYTAECYDRVRESRNFYVHGFNAVIPYHDVGPALVFSTIGARGQLKQKSTEVLLEEMDRTVDEAVALLKYIKQVHLFISPTSPTDYPRVAPTTPSLPRRLSVQPTRWPPVR